MPTPIRPVRLLMPWLGWSVGHVFAEMAPGQARDMIAGNLAEYADEPQPQNGYLHRMMEVAPKRKRGRPRKEQ